MKRRCMRRRHGAARPRAVDGMRLCKSCLADDWKNYYIDLRPIDLDYVPRVVSL